MTALDGAFSRTVAKTRAVGFRNTADHFRSLRRDAEVSAGESALERDRVAARRAVDLLTRHIDHLEAIADGFDLIARGETP